MVKARSRRNAQARAGRQLARYRDILKTIRERVHTAITAGKTLTQVKAERPTREWNDTLGKGFVNGDQLTEFVYTSLTKK